VPAVGVWRRPPLAHLALPRLATQGHVGVLSAASDPSIRSVWHALFFCVLPHARLPARPFHTTPPQGPSRLMKLPTDPCKDLRSFLWCTYEQIYDVVITMDHLGHTQRPSCACCVGWDAWRRNSTHLWPLAMIRWSMTHPSSPVPWPPPCSSASPLASGLARKSGASARALVWKVRRPRSSVPAVSASTGFPCMPTPRSPPIGATSWSA
jgi:hypothetical protein